MKDKPTTFSGDFAALELAVVAELCKEKKNA